MGKGKGKPGKGQNAPFSDAALEQRYQKLLRDRWAAGKDTISRARYARQLGHTGGNREPPSNLPIFTGRWRLLGPNPRPRPRYNVLLRLHHRSGANLIRMLAGLRSLPLQARLHRLRRPHLHRFRLLKCSFQSLRLHSRTLRSLWRARAGMHPFPPPLHQLRAQL